MKINESSIKKKLTEIIALTVVYKYLTYKFIVYFDMVEPYCSELIFSKKICYNGWVSLEFLWELPNRHVSWTYLHIFACLYYVMAFRWNRTSLIIIHFNNRRVRSYASCILTVLALLLSLLQKQTINFYVLYITCVIIQN